MQGDVIKIDEKDRKKIQDIGINTDEAGRSGSFVMENDKVHHLSIKQQGVEMLAIKEALALYPDLNELMWKLVDKDKDEYTKAAHEETHSGYFIRVKSGVKAYFPFQACFFIKQDKMKQKVHNLIILEENSEIHIMNGCAAASYLAEGSHIGVTEIYVGKNAKLMYTMIHDWAKDVTVRPRSAIKVEEGGTYISNYIALRDTKITQMYPVAHLDGKGAVAKFNTLVMAPEGSVYDLGSRVLLNAPDTRAEIISRSVSKGGTIIARGHLQANSPGVFAHLECDGLMLKDGGIISAIPELETKFADVNMSHEAAIGKVDEEQILYLMSRGIPKNEAVSAIVSGFMDVKLLGLPDALEEEIKKHLKVLEESEGI
ncbi:MAG: SufD family Fe-S cluster assembly protein [Candidatus Goldbacteria bacterium]|nr:SufD family Fe-S cluster assembly protein [Candidatus Goldiibacteriota bacterium]